MCWSESPLYAVTVSARCKAAKQPTHSHDEFAKRSLISFGPSAFVLSHQSLGVFISYCIYLCVIPWELVLTFVSVSPGDLALWVCLGKSCGLKTGLWLHLRSLAFSENCSKVCGFSSRFIVTPGKKPNNKPTNFEMVMPNVRGWLCFKHVPKTKLVPFSIL